ncbi:MAG: DUF2807 domain-containing protein [Bacteroidetes bacterium]|nr:DUF2807 domain-containing protein [Bacteroidota bacterium]
MKNLIPAAFLTLGLLLHAKAQTASFTKVHLNGNVDVVVEQSDSFLVAINASENNAPKIKTTISNEGVLTITTDAGIKTSEKASILIKVPKLNELEINGSGNIKSKGTLTTDNIALITKSTGSMDLNIKASEINATIHSIGVIKLAGETSVLNTEITGVGSIDAFELQSNKTKVSISGAGSAQVQAKDKLEASVSGVGSVVYKGTPSEKIIEVSGLGAVKSKETKEMVRNPGTKFNFFNKQITVEDDEIEGEEEKKYEYDAGDFKHWRGIGFGINGYMRDASFVLPGGYPYLELDYAKSFSFSWNVIERQMRLTKNAPNVNLFWGVGFEWNSYALQNNYRLRPSNWKPEGNVILDAPPLTLGADYEATDVFTKNKLKTVFVKVPLMLEINSSSNPDKNFHVAAGVIGGYRLAAKTKIKYEKNNDEKKEVVKNDYFINPFRVEAAFRIGYKHNTLFANYALTSLFQDTKGPELNPFTIGIHRSI